MVQLINATTPLEEARAILAENFDLKFSKAVQRATAGISSAACAGRSPSRAAAGSTSNA